MSGSQTRVFRAFAHQTPDRTPLFEIFQPYHPIHWEICGRNPATDDAMAWDARVQGIAARELLEMEARAQYEIRAFFELDMVRLNSGTPAQYVRPVKTGPASWTLNGIPHVLDERTRLVVPADAARHGYSSQVSEASVRREIESWDGRGPAPATEPDPLFRRVRELADAAGLDWVYMGEIGRASCRERV